MLNETRIEMYLPWWKTGFNYHLFLIIILVVHGSAILRVV